MPTRRFDGLALTYAAIRGVMLIVLSLLLLVAPERVMPGSTAEPAWRLALIVASRTGLLGSVLAVLAVRRRRGALAWVLLADAALQAFDTGAALLTGKGMAALFPAALGVLDAWAGRVLLRASRE